jgi:hypothetical protein
MKIQFITRKLAVSALVATALGTSLTATAVVETVTVGFTTVVDLVISPENSLNLGQFVLGTAGSTCTVTTDSYAAATVAASAATATITDSLSGAGCVTVAADAANNFSGVYGVTGAASQAFTVTLSSVTGTNFDFSPSGQVGDVVAGVGAGVALLADTPNDSATDANGEAMIVVAGIITIGAADLDAATAYSEDFDITAVY